MSRAIIIVDDEGVAVRHVIQDLELDGYVVTHFKRAAACKGLIQNPSAINVDMFVLDLMMPSAGIYDNVRTEFGTLTGLYLARDLRIAFPDTPILIWSNANVPALLEQAKDLEKNISNCAFINKHRFTPEQIVDLINSYFEKSKFSKGFFKNFWDSLLLEPNFSGVGIDIKKLLGK